MSPKIIPDFDKIHQYEKEIPELEKKLKEILPKSYTTIYGLRQDTHEDEKREVRRLRQMIRWRKSEINRLLYKNWSGILTQF